MVCFHLGVFSVTPPPYTKEMVYENNEAVFEVVDATAIEVANDEYYTFASLVRSLVGRFTSDLEKVRSLFR